MQEAKICHICKEEFNGKLNEDQSFQKVRNNSCSTGKNKRETHSICNLRYKTPEENFFDVP